MPVGIWDRDAASLEALGIQLNPETPRAWFVPEMRGWGLGPPLDHVSPELLRSSRSKAEKPHALARGFFKVAAWIES